MIDAKEYLERAIAVHEQVEPNEWDRADRCLHAALHLHGLSGQLGALSQGQVLAIRKTALLLLEALPNLGVEP